jgi:HNH endonuclease
MKIIIIKREAKDQYPHGIQLVDLAEELQHAGLPALSAVERGSVSRPELGVRFDAEVVDEEERTLPDGVVRIEFRPFRSYKQDRLDGKLIFKGLREALSDLGIRGASCWSDGRFSEMALRVGLAEPLGLADTASISDGGDFLGPEEADQTESDLGDLYEPEGTDRRPLVERQIRERRGQRQFRDALRRRYGDRCLITACEILAVLEAAHISPYRGEDDNHPENGLLLRTDIHTLFDLDLLGIEPERLMVEVHPGIAPEYGHLAGVTLRCAGGHRPSRKALMLRYGHFRQRLHRPV